LHFGSGLFAMISKALGKNRPNRPNRWCRPEKSCVPCSATGREFCWLNSYHKAQQSMQQRIVKPRAGCGMRYRTKGATYLMWELFFAWQCTPRCHGWIIPAACFIQMGAVGSPPLQTCICSSTWRDFWPVKFSTAIMSWRRALRNGSRLFGDQLQWTGHTNPCAPLGQVPQCGWCLCQEGDWFI
jgi:hypothetical protein